MTLLIEDYGFLSNRRSAALVGKNGSVDWLCLPRFDSGSVFAALLGHREHGRWLLAPSDTEKARLVSWGYTDHNFILESVWESETGRARVIDFMPIAARHGSLLRRVEGISGRMEFHQELTLRFEYATVVPWMVRETLNGEPALFGIAGPNAIVLHGPHLPKGNHNSEKKEHAGNFAVKAGEICDFELSWYPSHLHAAPKLDVDQALFETEAHWHEWAQHSSITGKYAADVERSLLTLRALTDRDTGGIVAAATTSLPEAIGGERNWDYRFCWLRDAALTLQAMLKHGYATEAELWRDWLLRAVAGDPADLQIMYGLSGERNLPESELKHLPGYENSAPVRIGNGAVDQYQADVVGEVLVALDDLRESGVAENRFSWGLQRSLLEFMELNFDRKDQGLWEMRGESHYFTQGRVMMWAGYDRCIKAARKYELSGDVEVWEAHRDALRKEILEKGFNEELNSFTQTYETDEVDASLLVIAHVGFVAYDDPRMLGTVKRIEDTLGTPSGLLLRYRTESGLDGLAPGEHPFLAVSFWLVRQYAKTGRVAEAEELMGQLCGYANELGLLSEEYDPDAGRMIGNYPQAFSHLALVFAADAVHEALDAQPAPAQ